MEYLHFAAEPLATVYASAFPAVSTPPGIDDLACALATSAPWAAMRTRARIVVTGDPPSLTIVGEFTQEDHARLGRLREVLEGEIHRVHHVDEFGVRDAVDALAAKLRALLGGSLRAHRFQAIPRGGLVVLGFLGYSLDLEHQQFAPDPPGRPLVLVDDCVLSGVRLCENLEAIPDDVSVVVAVLFVVRGVSRALHARFGDRVRLVSAFELPDLAPELRGDDYLAWRERWRSRSGDCTLWIGLTDRLSFPWKEPDSGFWNDEAGRLEADWHLVPPRLCAGNRLPPDTLRHVQVHRPAAAGIRAAPHVVYAEFDDAVVILDLHRERATTFEGPAAVTWSRVLDTGTTAPAVDALMKEYAVGEQEARRDVASFVRQLEADGILTVAGDD